MKIKLFNLLSVFTLLGAAIGCTAGPALPSTTAPLTQAPPISLPAEPTAAQTLDTWKDDFNEVLAPGWSWVDQDSSHWNLSEMPGTLRVITQGQSLYNTDKPKNLLLRDAPDGDFEITTKVTFDPKNNFQQAAILMYQDEDNFVLLNRGFCDVCLGSGSGFFLDNEINGKLDFDPDSRTETSLQTAWLKLRKEGINYIGFYSADGENWNELSRVENPMRPTKIGLTANNSNEDPGVPQIPADYDFFTVESVTADSSEAVATAVLSEPDTAPTLTTWSSNQLVATIPVGNLPFRLVIGEGGIWVTDQKDAAVYRIDPQTNQVVASIAVGKVPKGLLVSEDAVWVANTGGKTVSRIDAQTNEVVAAIEVGANPRSIAAGAGAIWVTSGTSEGLVSRIDPATNQIVATINVEAAPAQIAFANNSVWVTSTGSKLVSRIDPQTNQVVARIDVGQLTLAIVGDETAIWVAGDNPMLIRIDPKTNQVTAHIPVGANPWGIAIDIGSVWVASNSNDALWRIDPQTNQVLSIYKVGNGPLGLAIGENALWVVNSFDHTVWRIQP